LPHEKSDDYILRDSSGDPIVNLGKFKLLATSTRDMNSLASELKIGIKRVEYLVKLYQIPLTFRVKITRNERERRIREKKVGEGYAVAMNGRVYKKEYTRKEGKYYRDCYIGEDGTRKTILSHRRIVEEHINRKLTRDEQVHHIDGDKENNSIENLYVCDNGGEHSEIHNSLDKLAYELVDIGIIKFANGEYFLEEGFYDDIERYNYKKRIFNENLEYYKGEQLKCEPIEDL
jgi:hypothetical protein